MATVTYQKRTEPVFEGECSVCGCIIKPKTTSKGNHELFCHMCGGARHFCEHPECFFLHEVFYSRCEGENHRRLLVSWCETEITEEDWLAATEDDDGGVENQFRLNPNHPVFQ